MKEHHRATSLLLVTHVRLRRTLHGLQIDDQTAAGIRQWCRHFDKVTYFGIIDEKGSDASSSTWVDINDQSLSDRCEFVALPRAYSVPKMLKYYGEIRARLRLAIRQHAHLCFTIGGLVGDWPAIAALESIRQQRPYTAWIDRVEPVVFRSKAVGAPLHYRAAVALAVPLMERYTRHLLRHSSAALLQGRDTFDHYAPWSANSHCVYDTHTHISDQITPESILAKQTRVLSGSPLNILYIGRATAMKGPDDWLSVLKQVQSEGVPFHATWIGDGPYLPRMRYEIAGSALANEVQLPGFEGDRDTLLRKLTEGDLFLFCHKTLESPRCLIEALVSGCPLVGYGTPYSQGLVEAKGGAAFVPQNDCVSLAKEVVALHHDRASLARLIGMAAASGEAYNEDAVYAHRANLIQSV